jgi:O-antigen/teichoic acid export membrane protein
VSTTSSIFKGGLHLTLGQISSQVCSFIRNLIVARFISPADFGIAATFAMTLSLLEMISNLAAEMLLVQSPDGDDPRLQSTAQLLRAGRGFLNAFALLALAGPMSHLFGVPQARWAFAFLGIFPLARGFSNLDMNRMQRHMRFWPSVSVDLGANVVTTIAAIPLAYWLKDYSVMLWVLVGQAVFSAIGSHFVAERRYAWAWDKVYAKRIFAFGWPLLINGLLMYGIFEGDRLVIGSASRVFPHSHFTLFDLGVYSVAFGLTMAPTILVGNIGTSLFLPVLARVQHERSEFYRKYLLSSQVISLVAMMITVPFILVGGQAVVLLYGDKYRAAGQIIGWLAAMWGIRMFRVAPTVAAIAYGDTQNAMYANIARTFALVGMLVVAWVGGSLVWIPICGFGGEVLALAITVVLLERKQGVPAKLCLKSFVIFAFGIALATFAALQGTSGAGPIVSSLVALVIVAITVGITLATQPQLRLGLRDLIDRQRGSVADREVVLSE